MKKFTDDIIFFAFSGGKKWYRKNLKNIYEYFDEILEKNWTILKKYKGKVKKTKNISFK